MALPVQQRASFHSQALMLRGRAELTQRQLAHAIGVSERAIQVWEAGLGYPSARSLQRLAATYLERGAFSPGHEMDEAADFWHAAVGEGARLKSAFDAMWFAGQLAGVKNGSAVADGHEPTVKSATCRQDRGEAPTIATFHGRALEQICLKRWLTGEGESCHLVGIVGMGGIGKTALAARVSQDLAPRFENVLWRSLRNSLPADDWLAEAILFLSEQRCVPPEGTHARLRRLLELLRERRCLLVLDNMEAILQPGLATPVYRDGYADYGLILQSVAEASHQSCLLVTSREEPSELARLAGLHAPVRVLRLGGLDEGAGQRLLQDKGLRGTADAWAALVRRYSGNALALQVVGEFIARVFRHDIAAFLATGEAVFGDIRLLLEAQIARLSPTERAILYWLAIERDPVDFLTLVGDLGAGTPRHEIQDALQALDRRSLLEIGEDASTFTLQPVVLEHVTDAIISTCLTELCLAAPSLLKTHALVKATAKTYVRHQQECLIAKPLLERLAAVQTSDEIERSLVTLLDKWRGGAASKTTCADHGFGPGNVVNLLRIHRGSLRGLDLSYLVVRQAVLSTDAQGVNLAHSHLEDVTLAHRSGSATSVCMSADATHLGLGTIAGEIRLWSLPEIAPVFVERQPVGAVWHIAMSDNAKVIATCGGSESVWVWRTGGCQSQQLLTTNGGEFWCIALSADGRILAGGAADGTTHLWDLASGRSHTVESSEGRVRGVALSRSGRFLATGGGDGRVSVWDIRGEPQLMHSRMYAGEVRAIAVSADERHIVHGDADGLVHVRDLCTGEPDVILRGHTAPVWAVALSADGGLLASGSADHTLRLWDPRTGECRRVLHEHTTGVMLASLSADGQLAWSLGLDGFVSLWETRRGRCLSSSGPSIPAAFEVALSKDGRTVVCGGGDGAMRVWDTLTGQCTHILRGHSAAVWGAALSGDATLAVSGALDGTVTLWDLPTGGCRFVLNGNNHGVATVDVTADGHLIASGGWDGTLRVSQAATGESVWVEQCTTAGLRTVRFSASGDVLISGEADGSIRVWDSRSGRCTRVMNAHGGELRGLAISVDGRLIASAELGGRVRVWDSWNGECVRVIQAQTGGVRALALSADGKMVVSGGLDGTVQVFDVDTSDLLFRLTGHEAEVWGVSLNTDLGILVSGGLDGTVRLWDIRSTGNQLRLLRPDRTYERMDITGTSGITDVQRAAILELGAVDATARST